MVEVFHRALCAAGLPLAYSEGYHPHPRLSFGPPLALGILGDKELFDMVLTEAAQPHASTINGWLPQGLRLETLRSSQQKPDSLNANIVAARYVFVPHRVISGAALRKTVESVKNSKSLPVVSERNGQIVEKDVRPLIHKIEYYSHHDAACIDALLSMQARNTCRPVELLKVMFPEMRFSDFLVRRIECLTLDNGKFAVVR
jgi:radical SAM-linked protein